MKITFSWPALGGGDWSPEAAVSLIGQETKVEGVPGKVIHCHLTNNGPLEVTIEVEDDEKLLSLLNSKTPEISMGIEEEA